MITRKQYPNHHVYEMEIGGRAFTVETGKVAELANAECICHPCLQAFPEQKQGSQTELCLFRRHHCFRCFKRRKYPVRQ